MLLSGVTGRPFGLFLDCLSYAWDARSGETIYPSCGGSHPSDALHHQQGMWVLVMGGMVQHYLLSVDVTCGSVIALNT